MKTYRNIIKYVFFCHYIEGMTAPQSNTERNWSLFFCLDNLSFWIRAYNENAKTKFGAMTDHVKRFVKNYLVRLTVNQKVFIQTHTVYLQHIISNQDTTDTRAKYNCYSSLYYLILSNSQSAWLQMNVTTHINEFCYKQVAKSILSPVQMSLIVCFGWEQELRIGILCTVINCAMPKCLFCLQHTGWFGRSWSNTDTKILSEHRNTDRDKTRSIHWLQKVFRPLKFSLFQDF